MMDQDAEPPSDALTPPVIIPHAELQPETLRRVIEAFVLREGTEYGDHDVSLEHKVAQVVAQLHRGEAMVAFHPETESIDIVLNQRLRPR
jgi:uncharacterized protein